MCCELAPGSLCVVFALYRPSLTHAFRELKLSWTKYLCGIVCFLSFDHPKGIELTEAGIYVQNQIMKNKNTAVKSGKLVWKISRRGGGTCLV